MTIINFYRFDYNLNKIDLGQCDIDRALQTFNESCQMAQIEFKSGEEALAETSFGLCKSKVDFIEIACNGEDDISIHTDRLVYKSTLRQLFSNKTHFLIQGKKCDGVDAINTYFHNDRESFEKKYTNFLCA